MCGCGREAAAFRDLRDRNLHSQIPVCGKTSKAGNARPIANLARMAETTEAPLWNENEPAKVESWRLHILLEAGYPVHLAERIAVSEVDLHDAVQLLTRGCDPVTATEILL